MDDVEAPTNEYERRDPDEILDEIYNACSAGDLDSIKRLVNKENVNQPIDCDFRLIHFAVSCEKVKILSYLVKECGADISAKTFLTHQSALLLAVRNRNFVCVQWFVKECLSATDLLNQRDRNGWTPIHHVCWQGDLEIAKLLSQMDGAGATMNETSSICGNSCLHRACNSGPNPHKPELVKWLLHEFDLNVNEENSHGKTALGFACGDERAFPTVRLLVEEGGASLGPTGYQKWNPLHYACADQGLAAHRNRFEIVRYLVEHHNMDVNSIDESGNTPLILSMPSESRLSDFWVDETASYLLWECNANILARNKEGQVAKDFCSSSRRVNEVFERRQAFLQQRWDLVMYLTGRDLL